MEDELAKRLLDKSIEAFVLSLEIYNKPTIRYRIEGFSFFICNAWELMLKAKLLNDGKSIYYEDSNKTYSLSAVIGQIYTDRKQPLRENLERIISLRNDSTHFITEDYEVIYAPLFQACVKNFSEQIKRFHGVDITDYVAQNFLTLSVGVDVLTNDEIRAKYSKEMADRIIKHKSEIEILRETSTSADLYIPMRHEFFQTKDRRDADFTYRIDNKDDEAESVKILKQVIDPQDKYSLTAKNLINAVNKRLVSDEIQFNYRTCSGENKFNIYTLKLFIRFYNIKTDERYCYKFENLFRYSYDLVNLIVSSIASNPDIIVFIKKKIAPGS